MRRRLVTCTVVVVACAVVWVLLPVAVVVGGLIDVVSGGRLSLARASLFVAWYLMAETVGIVVSVALFGAKLVLSPSRLTWWRWNQRLQATWTEALWWAAVRIFVLRVDVRGDAECVGGPIVVLSRHTSLADTLLPAVFLAARHRILLRTVMKKELLWDPCLDIVGQRLPNAFVSRGGTDSEAEINKVRALAAGLSVEEASAAAISADGVLLYPEGTRFSADRLQRAKVRLAEHRDPRVAATAAALTHVLPPQLGGVTAALAAAPDADVVFCAHVGFDGIRRFGDLIRGSLVGRHIRVQLTRIARADIPSDPDEQVGWLLEQWLRMDAWVAKALADHASSRP
jgi:1-acyl-sn-glycerol-3-phosphate acyltransferase